MHYNAYQLQKFKKEFGIQIQEDKDYEKKCMDRNDGSNGNSSNGRLLRK